MFGLSTELINKGKDLGKPVPFQSRSVIGERNNRQ